MEYTRFPGVPLKPLEHLSNVTSVKNRTAKVNIFLKNSKKSYKKANFAGMKICRKAIAVAVFALFCTVNISAQTIESLSFSRIERSPRAAALAGAGTASLQSAAYASFTNSAVVPFYEGTADFAAGYELWAPSLGAAHAINAGGAYNFGRFGVSLGGVYQMEQPDFDGFRPGEIQINAGVGVRVLDWLGFGLGARYLRENVFEGYSNNGFGIDALALFVPVKGLSVSAGVVNLGGGIKDSAGNKYPQPSSLKLAAAYRLGINPQNALEFMLDEDYFWVSRSNAVSFGMEYSYARMVYARVGYRIATSGAAYPSHLGLGLGAEYKGFRLDVSYLTLSEAIGNSVAIGIGYRF